MAQTLVTEVPRKFKPLLQPMRYKGAYGGRGGAKSHFFAEEVVLRCYERETRVACIREVQQSIKDSVKQLLNDKIAKFGLESQFQVLDNEIRGKNGSLIIFRGMQSYNADNIKSLEGYDIAWVEEAQTLSQRSLDMLRPTLRKKGSELWFSWNPRFKSDPVDIFFRKGNRENAVSVNVNWQDNPWFKDTALYVDMLHDYQEDEDKAEHIWGGAYGNLQGAVLAKWVSKARRENRFRPDVVFDPRGAPVEISSDIGFRDTACWWFWQRQVRGFKVFAYMGESGLDADDWIPRIEEKLTKLGVPASKLGKIWLPPDAKAKTFQSKHSSVERFLKFYGPKVVRIKGASRKSDQISAARMIIKSCEFNSLECEAVDDDKNGIAGLEAWEFEYLEDDQVFSREPLHNWASHRGDSFAYGCEVMQGIAEEKPDAPTRYLEIDTTGAGPHPNQISLNDAWKTRTVPSRRI